MICDKKSVCVHARVRASLPACVCACVPACLCVCVCVLSAGQGLQSQSAAHADDALLSYVSSTACQDLSSTHTGKKHIHTLPLRAGQHSPWPGSPAAQDTYRFIGAVARCDSGPNITLLCGHGRHGGSAEK